MPRKTHVVDRRSRPSHRPKNSIGRGADARWAPYSRTKNHGLAQQEFSPVTKSWMASKPAAVSPKIPSGRRHTRRVSPSSFPAGIHIVCMCNACRHCRWATEMAQSESLAGGARAGGRSCAMSGGHDVAAPTRRWVTMSSRNLRIRPAHSRTASALRVKSKPPCREVLLAWPP